MSTNTEKILIIEKGTVLQKTYEDNKYLICLSLFKEDTTYPI